MALQHFYSRIPSRVSMFNKADSFDTFALSDGLSREFIERELSRIYENRPGLNESDFIRRGELPPAYCQITARSGELIQSCISFISKDYTGERSSYLVHSIVFSEEEKSKLLRSENERLLDKSAFLNNYDNFNVTDDNARPITDYPQKVDFARQIIGVEKVIDYYDANMLKRFIYTVLSIACGKGKNVFVILPDELSVFSDRALDLMESIMQILPFRLRDAVSFVTYTGDWAKYQSFKIKFLTKDNAQIPPAKGWILDFGLKTGNESLDKEVSKEIAVVDFFTDYSNIPTYDANLWIFPKTRLIPDAYPHLISKRYPILSFCLNAVAVCLTIKPLCRTMTPFMNFFAFTINTVKRLKRKTE